MLTAAVACRRFRVNRGAVLLGVLWPLCVGLIWWIGVAAAFWKSDPPKAVLDSLLSTEASYYGAEALWHSILFGCFGPLTYPGGPAGMQGWDFLGTGLWTALVMSSLIWVVRTRQLDASGRPKCTRRQLVLLIVWTVLYVGPIYVRGVMRIVHSLG